MHKKVPTVNPVNMLKQGLSGVVQIDFFGGTGWFSRGGHQKDPVWGGGVADLVCVYLFVCFYFLVLFFAFSSHRPRGGASWGRRYFCARPGWAASCAAAISTAGWPAWPAAVMGVAFSWLTLKGSKNLIFGS